MKIFDFQKDINQIKETRKRINKRNMEENKEKSSFAYFSWKNVFCDYKMVDYDSNNISYHF